MGNYSVKTGLSCKKKAKPKVLMIETGGWGGVWHYTCCLGNALYEQGVDLNVITSERFEEPFKLKFKVIPAIKKNQRYIINLIQTYKIVSDLWPVLIHIQSWFSARRDWLPVMICGAVKIPVVLTAHNLLPHDEEERNAHFMFWAFKRIYMSADAIIAHSRDNKEKLAKTYGIFQKKVSVIRHGNYRFFSQMYHIDPDKIRRELLKEKSKKRIFLIFGAMRYYKGIDLALRAMSRVSKLERMHLLIAGKPYGKIMEECKELSETLDISESVTFLASYFSDRDVAKLHSSADIVLFPYRNIFQSGALQTALAFGKPVIATSVGSFPETLNEKNAWLIEPNSAEALSFALEDAVTVDNQKLEFMGRESLRISTEECAWSKIATMTKKVYLNLI